MNEKQKIKTGQKAALIFAFISIAFLAFVIFYDENPVPKYSVRKETTSDVNNNAKIEIVLTKKEPNYRLKNIANKCHIQNVL